MRKKYTTTTHTTPGKVHSLPDKATQHEQTCPTNNYFLLNNENTLPA